MFNSNGQINSKTNYKNILPPYAILPAIGYLVFLPVYFVTRMITAGQEHYDFRTGLDDAIPFIIGFIWIYVLAYLQWLIGYVVIAKSEREICETYFAAEVTGKIICGIIFITLPTIMIRPEIVGDGLSEWVTRGIYEVDAPTNLFPSIHCMESYIVTRAAFKSTMPRIYKVFMLIFTVLVCMSVILVKQHVAVDIIGGLIVAEISIQISKKLKFGRIYGVVGRLLHIKYYGTE